MPFLQTFKQEPIEATEDQAASVTKTKSKEVERASNKKKPEDAKLKNVKTETEDTELPPIEEVNNKRGGKRSNDIRVKEEHASATMDSSKRRKMDADYLDDQLKEVESLDDLLPVILPKSLLVLLASKLNPEKFKEVVKHCYVRMLNKTDRLNHYTLYRIVQGIDTETPIGKSKYARRLKLENQAERILESVEEQPLAEPEFEMWIQNARQKDLALPTVQWVRRRAKEIQLARDEALMKSEIDRVQELRAITLDQDQLLALLVSEEGRSLVIGCFVRVTKSIGHNVVAEIADLKPTNPYAVRMNRPNGGEHRVEHALFLRYADRILLGRGEFRIDIVSSPEITQEEFKAISNDYKMKDLLLPTREYVKAKWEAIVEFGNSIGHGVEVKKEE